MCRTIQTGGDITQYFMISISVQFPVTTEEITEVINRIIW